MFVQTTSLLTSAHTHLVAAIANEGDNRREVARAADACQEVRELVYRRPGSPLATLTTREVLADNVLTLIRTAQEGHTLPYNRDRLVGAVAILDANGFSA